MYIESKSEEEIHMESCVVNQKQRRQVVGIYRINGVFMIEFHDKDTEFCNTEIQVYEILERIK